MSRLFITPREINFINDLGKEIVKDVIGQFIYYYPISTTKSNVHEIYEESTKKVFENPIRLGCLVKYEPQEIRANKFGSEEFYTIEVYVQSRDLLDKQLQVEEGDFFSYGSVFFEVITVPDSNIIYGEVEHKGFSTITGKQARKGLFETHVFGPTDESYSDPDAVEENYYQQRGYKDNQEGITGDIRELQKNKVLDKPLTGPKGVTKKAGGSAGSSFYGGDDD
jgi:hypothetical protein